MGLIGGMIQPIYAGNPTTLLSPVDFLQQPSRWLQTISAERISVSGGPNFAYELCIDKITPAQCEGLDLSCWDVAFCGAEPVRAETLARFTAKFAPYGFRFQAFTPCLGMAESTLMTSCTPQAQAPVVTTFDTEALAHNRVAIPSTAVVTTQNTQQLVSSGRAWLDQTFCIVHPETGLRCASDEVGEIWIAGPSVAAGYWQRPTESAQTFGATIADTGEGPFLRSGDLGFIHNGELFVTGRRKDLIIIRGKNYYPQDLEATVEQAHPALQPGAVAAFSIEEENEEKLVIVQEIERTHLRNLVVDELLAAIRQAIAQEHQLQVSAIALLRPGRILKTSSGKIQRRATRQAYLAGALATVGVWALSAEALAVAPPTIPSPMPQPAGQPNPAVNGGVRFPNGHPPRTLEGWIAGQLAQRLHTEPSAIDLHKPFADYGLDSMAAVELVHALQNWLQSTGRTSTIEVTDLWDFPTIAALARHLEGDHQPLTAPLHRTFTPQAVRTAGQSNSRTTAVVQSNPVADKPELAAELAQLARLLMDDPFKSRTFDTSHTRD
jgi:acyl carrier protein